VPSFLLHRHTLIFAVLVSSSGSFYGTRLRQISHEELCRLLLPSLRQMGTTWCEHSSGNPALIHGVHPHSFQWSIDFASLESQHLLHRLPCYFHGCRNGCRSNSNTSEIRLASKLRRVDQLAHHLHLVSSSDLFPIFVLTDD
jgi:hypothetical protein